MLFVYDALDENSEFYITHLREQLREKGFTYDEVAVKSKADFDPISYDTIVVYSRVMGFNMSSPVRGWLKSVKSLKNTRVYLFVTAARWFEQKHKEQLAKIAAQKDPKAVNAVTSATEKMTPEQKIESMRKFVRLLGE